MGEWSDSFEDFPKESPANWVNGRFDPALRARINQQEGEYAVADAKANAELRRMIEEAKREAKARSLLVVEDCPQCGLKELNTYKISERFFLCECQECGTLGNGVTHEEALERTTAALGEGLN